MMLQLPELVVIQFCLLIHNGNRLRVVQSIHTRWHFSQHMLQHRTMHVTQTAKKTTKHEIDSLNG